MLSAWSTFSFPFSSFFRFCYLTLLRFFEGLLDTAKPFVNDIPKCEGQVVAYGGYGLFDPRWDPYTSTLWEKVHYLHFTSYDMRSFMLCTKRHRIYLLKRCGTYYKQRSNHALGPVQTPEIFMSRTWFELRPTKLFRLAGLIQTLVLIPAELN